MADLLEQAASWLDSQRTKFLSRLILYCRGSNWLEVSAGIGKTLFEVDDGYGAIERFESRDFLISASSLVISGQQTFPKAGDTIKEPGGGQVFLFEVLAPGKEPCWRFSDSYHKTLRIHTKQVGTE